MIKPMGRNFLIAYTAREGSTALVDALSLHPDISVPLLEELDRFWIKKFYGKVDVAQEVARTLQTNRFDLGKDYAYRNFVTGKKRGAGTACVGFKWRPHGNVIKLWWALRGSDLTWFFLFRRDFDELCSSLAISRQGDVDQTASAGHAQFRYARMMADEQAEMRRAIDSVTHRVDDAAYRSIAWRRAVHALRLGIFAIVARAVGATVVVLYYEDFLGGREHFLSRFLEAVGLPGQVPADVLAGGVMKKAATRPARERISNHPELNSMLSVRVATLLYVFGIRLIRAVETRPRLTRRGRETPEGEGERFWRGNPCSIRPR